MLPVTIILKTIINKIIPWFPYRLPLMNIVKEISFGSRMCKLIISST